AVAVGESNLESRLEPIDAAAGIERPALVARRERERALTAYHVRMERVLGRNRTEARLGLIVCLQTFLRACDRSLHPAYRSVRAEHERQRAPRRRRQRLHARQREAAHVRLRIVQMDGRHIAALEDESTRQSDGDAGPPENG